MTRIYGIAEKRLYILQSNDIYIFHRYTLQSGKRKGQTYSYECITLQRVDIIHDGGDVSEATVNEAASPGGDRLWVSAEDDHPAWLQLHPPVIGRHLLWEWRPRVEHSLLQQG